MVEPLRSRRSIRWHRALILALLAGATLLVYAQTIGFGFVYFDDNVYVERNPYVRAGLTAAGAKWAFTTNYQCNWHPLTWLSLMLDAQIAGGSPWIYHLVNFLLHLANTGLLFLLLDGLTGFAWRSGFVAALFAVHPLHVESVAWIAERKDVLSTFFGLLALLAYARYASRPGRAWYALAAALLAGSLMSKPMLVTLPVLFLLLDYWPLGRFAHPSPPSLWGGRGRQGLFWEKLPLFALSAASSAAALIAHKTGGGLPDLEKYPLAARFGNALFSYLAYLAQTAWPAGLAVLYPHPGSGLPLWKTAVSAIIMAAITALAWRLAQSRPYLAVGWLWYLISLLPVIGIVQVGVQARADRYTYVPLIGIFLAAVWGLSEAARALDSRLASRKGRAASSDGRKPIEDPPDAGEGRAAWKLRRGAGSAMRARAGEPDAGGSRVAWKLGQPAAGARKAIEGQPAGSERRLARTVLAVASIAALAALAVAARAQAAHWRDGMALFTRNVAVTPDNAVAENNLGYALDRQGKIEEAMERYLEALRIDPGYAEAAANLAGGLIRQRRFDEAIAVCRETLRLSPAQGRLHTSLGMALLMDGKGEEAREAFAESLRIRPNYAPTHVGVGLAFVDEGKPELAVEPLQHAARLDPELFEARLYLGMVLTRLSRFDEAIAPLADALRISPGNETARRYMEMARARRFEARAVPDR